jgi:hypothetical protein
MAKTDIAYRRIADFHHHRLLRAGGRVLRPGERRNSMRTRAMAVHRAFVTLFIVSVAIATMLMADGYYGARAEDKGQWNAYHLSNDQKDWFKTVRDSLGNTCCDGADGYPVDYEMRGNKYWVHFRGRWMEVEERAVKRQPNPIGEGVAWFYFLNGDLTVRCFVPGPGG